MYVEEGAFQQSFIQVMVHQGIVGRQSVAQLRPYRCVYYYHQIVVFHWWVNQDAGSNDLGQGDASAAQVVHCADCAPEGPAQGKAAPDGVGIGVPVAEVEDIFIPADVIAILLLADAHGFI